MPFVLGSAGQRFASPYKIKMLDESVRKKGLDKIAAGLYTIKVLSAGDASRDTGEKFNMREWWNWQTR